MLEKNTQEIIHSFVQIRERKFDFENYENYKTDKPLIYHFLSIYELIYRFSNDTQILLVSKERISEFMAFQLINF